MAVEQASLGASRNRPGNLSFIARSAKPPDPGQRTHPDLIPSLIPSLMGPSLVGAKGPLFLPIFRTAEP